MLANENAKKSVFNEKIQQNFLLKKEKCLVFFCYLRIKRSI